MKQLHLVSIALLNIFLLSALHAADDDPTLAQQIAHPTEHGIFSKPALTILFQEIVSAGTIMTVFEFAEKCQERIVNRFATDLGTLATHVNSEDAIPEQRAALAQWCDDENKLTDTTQHVLYRIKDEVQRSVLMVVQCTYEDIEDADEQDPASLLDETVDRLVIFIDETIKNPDYVHLGGTGAS